MLGRELQAFGDSALNEQRRDGEQNAEEVDAAHHLNTCSAVGGEDFALPVRSEAVEDHVHAKQEQSGYRGDWRVLALVVASTQEENHSNGDGHGDKVLVELVFVS